MRRGKRLTVAFTPMVDDVFHLVYLVYEASINNNQDKVQLNFWTAEHAELLRKGMGAPSPLPILVLTPLPSG